MRSVTSVRHKLTFCASVLSLSLSLSNGVDAQGVYRNGWASKNDLTVKQLIERERQWATLSCTPRSDIVNRARSFIDGFISDNFVGTHPKGDLYRKSDMMRIPQDWKPDRDCKLLSARVRFFIPDIAIIYGAESAVAKNSRGGHSVRTLVWTDTLQKRSGKWQVIAVQDMALPSIR
ncbi:MAG: nuclear transport factor 2 family protein [Janthinobacterium lividum]